MARASTVTTRIAFVALAIVLGALLVVTAYRVQDGGTFPACQAAGNPWDGRTPTIVSLEFAGSSARAGAITACWSAPQRQALRDGVNADTWLILAYVANLGLWCWYGTRHLWRSARRRLGWIALGAVVIGGALDLLVENPALRAILDGHNGAAVRATAAALTKWVLLIIAAGYAVGAVVASLARVAVAVTGPEVVSAFRQPSGFVPPDFPAPPPANLVDVPESEAPPTYRRRYDLPVPVEPGGVSVSLSGGGIRSAAFSTGCLQVFDAVPFPGDADGRTVMGRADYLATVSGGGYIGGGRQILQHDLQVRGDPADHPYGEGEPETAFLHDNHNYLWDTVREAALGVTRLLVGIAVNVGVLAALVFVVARPLGWLTFSTLLGAPGAQSAPSGFWWGLALGVVLVLVVALAAGVISAPRPRRRPQWIRATQRAVIGAAAVALILGIVGWRGPDFAHAWVPFAAAAATAVVIVVAGFVSRVVKPLAGIVAPLRTSVAVWVLVAFGVGLLAFWLDGAAADVDAVRPSLGPLIRLAAGIVLTTAVVFVIFSVTAVRLWLHRQTFGRQATVIAIPAAIGFGATVIVMIVGHWADVRVEELTLWTAVAIALLFVYAVVDQKLWSPHLFYKRRLATAFSTTRSGPHAAQQLPYQVKTAMSSWGARVPGQPQLLLCCAVHTSNLDISVRRRVWSYTFAGDYVGGPDVGWMRTIDLEATLGRENAGDGTLLAAMAISGAAIASSMGSLSHGSNAAVAVADARLGVWLPNPRYVRRLRDQQPGELVPWLRWRRVSYFIKELLGVFDIEDRFVYVSDGGHIENYGILELLARQVRVIVCCDGSGDSYDAKGGPTTVAGTLRHALRMAQARFGISIEAIPVAGAPFPVNLDDDRTLAAAVQPLVPTAPAPAGAEALQGRLSADSVIMLRLTHDALAGPGRTPPQTWLLVAKATLTPDICTDAALAPVREAAGRYRNFPNDPTVDQWLTDAQFDGYVALGRHVAARAHARLTELTVPDSSRLAGTST